MVVTLSGMVTEGSLSQLSNAKLPMVVTPLPMVTEVKESQSRNERTPMVMTLSGMVTAVKKSQSKKAHSSIIVTGYPPKAEGMVRFFSEPLYLVMVALPLLTVYS